MGGSFRGLFPRFEQQKKKEKLPGQKRKKKKSVAAWKKRKIESKPEKKKKRGPCIKKKKVPRMREKIDPRGGGTKRSASGPDFPCAGKRKPVVVWDSGEKGGTTFPVGRGKGQSERKKRNPMRKGGKGGRDPHLLNREGCPKVPQRT